VVSTERGGAATQELISGEHATAWVLAFDAAINTHREELTELDRQSGDGDFGSNVSSATGRAVRLLASTGPTPGARFAAMSEAFLNTGGTSGPLFGMWFRGFADAVAEDAFMTALQLADGAARGMASVQRFGKANIGDKTMVDAMAPAVVALRSAANDGLGAFEAIRSAGMAARLGTESTAGQVARRGRASYVGAAAKGVVDAGALAVTLFFESAAGVLLDRDDA
jgi:dihydroxyacetone kinase-like protein